MARNRTKGQAALHLGRSWTPKRGMLPVTLKSRPSKLKIGAQISSLKSQTTGLLPNATCRGEWGRSRVRQNAGTPSGRHQPAFWRMRLPGWRPPEEKDDDVAAFARTRVHPGGACHQTAFWRRRLPNRPPTRILANAATPPRILANAATGPATDPHSGECGYTDPHSGECGYTDLHSGECGYRTGHRPAFWGMRLPNRPPPRILANAATRLEAPGHLPSTPWGRRTAQTSIPTLRVGMLTESAAVVIRQGSQKMGGEFHDATGRRPLEI